MDDAPPAPAAGHPGRVSLLRYVDAPLALAVLGLGGLLTPLAVAVARRRGVDPGRRRAVRAQGALVTCLGVVLVLALSGGRPGRRALNLVPLRTVVDQAHNPDLGLLVVNLAGNVLCFVPLGALLVVVLRRGAVAASAAGTAFSAAVEVVQYGLGRTADVDDVLLNGAGVALGAACVVLARSRAGRAPDDARRRHRSPARRGRSAVPAAGRSERQVTSSTTP